MNRGPKIFVPVISCLAALSFAAGRIATKPRVEPRPGPAAPVGQNQPPERAASITIPDHVPDLVKLPFVETYRIMKSASPETVAAYYHDLEQLPVNPRRATAMTAFFKTLIQANPRLAKNFILQLKKDDRWLPMQAIREAATPRGMETVAEVLLSFDRGEISGCSFDYLRDSLDDWGKSDPLALKQFLESHRDKELERYNGNLVLNWAAYDPEAAREWMMNEIEKRPLLPTEMTEDGGERIFDGSWRSAVQSMETGWLQGFLANDPDRATQYIFDHADNPAVQEALLWVAGDLFLLSPERARDLIVRLPADQQSRSLSGIGSNADELVASATSDNTTSPRFIAEWMLEFPAEAYREGIGSVLGTWLRSNAPELFAWMSDLPASSRDEIIRQFPSVGSETAQKDFDLVMHVAEPVLRTQLLEHYARTAGYADKEFRSVLERSQLPAQEKARLVNLIRPREDATVLVDGQTE
jgi:hypothetical protein